MAEALAEQIFQKLEHISQNYYRLILVVAPAGSGKTQALQIVSKRIGAAIININLELSQRMLDIPENQRAIQLSRLLTDILKNGDNEIILLDNTEILFDVELKADPLRLLQSVARNRTIIATWNGSIIDNYLTYAEPHHKEYKRFPINDLIVASPELQ